MKTTLITIIMLAFAVSASYSLEPVRGAVKYTGGGAVAVEVQLYDFGTSTNVYPGAGSQSLGNLTANTSGVISFVVGKNDAAWTAITAASVTNNYMLVVTVGGTVAAYLKLDELQIEQGVYGSEIDESVLGIPDGEILIGNSSDEAVSHPISGDASMTNDGELTVEGLQGNDVHDANPTDGQVLTWDNANSRWAPATPAGGGGGGGGSGTFFLEFSSFNNGSCCNDRKLNVAASSSVAATLFMNSTQPKPAYGQPFAVDLEVVSVSVYLNLTSKTLVAPVNFNVTPYICNITSGATDRALTASIDLATLAEDTWHTIPLSSATPADNLVDASANQYVMWELNSTHGGGESDTEGNIIFRVEVKYP
jgi:hypothetical protein